MCMWVYITPGRWASSIRYWDSIGQGYSVSRRKHAEAVMKYQNYIKAKGPGWILWGEDPTSAMSSAQAQSAAHTRKTEEIRELIISGVRRTALIAKYPSMVQVISKLMELRPPRTHDTDCLFIWGPTGDREDDQRECSPADNSEALSDAMLVQ